MGGGGAAAAAAAAAVARAIKASGAIVKVPPEDFQKLLDQNAQGLVVHAPPSFFYRRHKYIMGFKGLAFYAVTAEPLSVPRSCQVVEAKRIWIPG